MSTVRVTEEGRESPDSGIKYDGGKPRWDLMQFDFLNEVAKVLTFGAQKYADDNWKKIDGIRRRYFAAAMRHLIAWWGGEDNDKESGLHHLAHAACCLMFMFWEDKHGAVDRD